MSGPITISLAALVAIGLAPRSEVLFDQLDRVLAQEQIRVGEEVADVQVAGQHDLGPAEVLERATHGVVRRRQDDERRAVEADGAHELFRLARLRLVEDKALDDADLAVDRLLAEGAAQREPAHLLRHLLRVVTRLGSEDLGAALHARLAGRAVTRPPGALLAIGLGATAADVLPRLRAGVALAGVSELA